MRSGNRRILRIAVIITALACLTSMPAARAQQLTPPNIPLMIGMTPDQASLALGVQLYYVRGRPGNELLVVLSNVKGATLAYRSDGLYLQFRNGRLSGWKGDWGTIRP
jgi:hypothetical protein